MPPNNENLREAKMVDEELLKIMCCPACRGDVVEREGRIVCLQCGRRYPIRDGIPVMLVDEAETPGGKD